MCCWYFLVEAVQSLWKTFDGFSGWSLPSSKTCQVKWSGPLQGRLATWCRVSHDVEPPGQPGRVKQAQRRNISMIRRQRLTMSSISMDIIASHGLMDIEFCQNLPHKSLDIEWHRHLPLKAQVLTLMFNGNLAQTINNFEQWCRSPPKWVGIYTWHDAMLDLSGTFCLVSSSIETLGHTWAISRPQKSHCQWRPNWESPSCWGTETAQSCTRSLESSSKVIQLTFQSCKM